MDDSVRKKTWVAPASSTNPRNADPLPVLRRPAEEPIRAQDPATIVPLSSGRKSRPKSPRRKDPDLASIDVHIGRQLKAIYDDVLNQPIPDRFLELLGQLDAVTQTGSGSKDESDSS